MTTYKFLFFQKCCKNIQCTCSSEARNEPLFAKRGNDRRPTLPGLARTGCKVEKIVSSSSPASQQNKHHSHITDLMCFRYSMLTQNLICLTGVDTFFLQYSSRATEGHQGRRLLACGFVFVLLRFETQATWYPVLVRLWLEKSMHSHCDKKLKDFSPSKETHAPCQDTASLHAARPGLPRHCPGTGFRVLQYFCSTGPSVQEFARDPAHIDNLTPFRNTLLGALPA